MSGLGIGLLIIGAVFFIGSFFVSEKLSSSDMDEISGLSEDQIKALIDKHLNEADEKLDSALSEKVEEKSEEFIAGADKETNNRIMSIGEYADSVFDSMSKTHDEIVFLYQMLNDKQDVMTKLTKTLGEAESHVRELLTEAEKQKQLAEAQSKNLMSSTSASVQRTEAVKTAESSFPPLPKSDDSKAKPVEPSVKQTDEAAAISDLRAQAEEPQAEKEPEAEKTEKKNSKQVKEQADTKKIREKIISMYHQGYSLLDIAKETGKGIGEVSLILELFDEKEEKASE